MAKTQAQKSRNRLNRLVIYAVRKAVRSPYSMLFLGIYAFLQAVILPLPVDLLLAPMVLLYRRRVVQYALVCTLGSVLGGMTGYAIGYFAFDTIVGIFHHSENVTAVMDRMIELYRDYGVWAIFIGAFSPIPYKLFVVTSGLLQFPFVLFSVVSMLGRGLRFGLICTLFWYFGPTVKNFISRKLPAMLLILVTIIAAIIYLGTL